MLAFLGSFLLVALVNAQRPKPCEAPPEWNAREITVKPRENLVVSARLSYDRNGERLSLIREVDVNKTKKMYEFISLYREKTMYVIELNGNKTESCIKRNLSTPFPLFKIPANATFMGVGTIGSNAFPGLGVNVAVFTGESGEARYYMTVTQPGCIPVSEGLASNKYGYLFTSFYDVELGYDPERFVPPKECE